MISSGLNMLRKYPVVCALFEGKWQENVAVDKWVVMSPPAGKYFLSSNINVMNRSPSPPKENQFKSLDFWNNQSVWLSFLSEIGNHIEAAQGKLPKVIWSCSHERPGQMDGQVRRTWGSDWCSSRSLRARSASSHELYHLLWSAMCHLATLERHLRCEQSFLSD